MASDEDAVRFRRLADEERAKAAATQLENTRMVHLRSADRWDRLAVQAARLSSPTADQKKIDHTWPGRWLDRVAAGDSNTSQRLRSTVDKNGGIEAIVLAAKSRGLHLIQLTDDEGKIMVAASRSPFEVFC